MNICNKDPSRRLEIVRKAAPRSAKPSAVRRCRVVADSLGQVQVFIAQTRGPMARLADTDLAYLTICSSTSTAVKWHRTAALTHDDLTPSIFMGLQMTGSCVVVQHEREAILRRGDLVIYDSTTPCEASPVSCTPRYV